MRTLCAILVVLGTFTQGCNDVRSMRRARDVDGLVRSLDDPDEQVRVKAVDALGQLSDDKAIPALVRALKDPSRYVREHAALNLGCNRRSSLGCDSSYALEPLAGLLDDRDPFVRLEAARALGEMRDGRARERLEKASGDERWEVRLAVSEALGKLGDQASQPTLEKLASDRNERVREAARLGLDLLERAQGPTTRAEAGPGPDDGGARAEPEP